MRGPYTRFVVAVAAKDGTRRQAMYAEVEQVVTPEPGTMLQLCEGEVAPSRGVTVVPRNHVIDEPTCYVNLGTYAVDDEDSVEQLMLRMKNEGWAPV